jgi:hypothetical protein
VAVDQLMIVTGQMLAFAIIFVPETKHLSLDRLEIAIEAKYTPHPRIDRSPLRS